MKKLPELLAPAGSLECLKAAVCGGADAVYFGVPQFNARMKAKNFTPDELEQAFELCALYGVKTNVTLNTLLYGREFAPALDVVAGLEEKYRPDAYIVQDLGLARELKKRFPDIVLHASTQAEVHNAFHGSWLPVRRRLTKFSRFRTAGLKPKYSYTAPCAYAKAEGVSCRRLSAEEAATVASVLIPADCRIRVRTIIRCRSKICVLHSISPKYCLSA